MGRLLARQLGYQFLDTGAMYRALAWLAIEQGIDFEDEDALSNLASNSTIGIGGKDDEVFVNGRLAPLEEQRTEIDKKVSLVARMPEVRRAMVDQQRRLAKGGKMVMAGRDIGTVVVPNAPLKLYFQASVQERAKRRYLELQAQGHDVELDRVLDEIVARDRLDSERAHSPLQPAEDSRLIDTEGLTVVQVEEKILKLIEAS